MKMIKEKTTKCPVCKEIRLERALTLHIYQSAVREVYAWYSNRKVGKPHQDFIDKNKKSIRCG